MCRKGRDGGYEAKHISDWNFWAMQKERKIAVQLGRCDRDRSVGLLRQVETTAKLPDCQDDLPTGDLLYDTFKPLQSIQFHPSSHVFLDQYPKHVSVSCET